MKIAVTGKGGAGKTTVSASLARCFRKSGRRVTAVDADPDANLATTLGYRGPGITPLAALKPLIEERVGDGWGGFLRMNPRVEDIPERFSVTVENIRILVMGTIERGRSGCACPENVLLREVLNHVLVAQDEHVIVDMEAGIEHLGRGTAEGVDRMLVVVEPGWASLQTASRVAALARDLGIDTLHAVANKISSAEDETFLRKNLDGLPVLGWLPRDPKLETEARTGHVSEDRPFHIEMERLSRELEKRS